MGDYKEEIRLITRDLVNKCVKGFCKKIKELDDEIDFVRNDYVRNKRAGHHIMYKLRNDDGSLWLEGENGRKYEFLIEFDKEDFAYGIYFGCKCILDKNAEVTPQVEECKNEWDCVRPYVIEALNHTFVDFDFSKRDIPTDNAHDSTYWPFWFRLGEDEDVKDVAAVATRVIRNIYKWFFESGRPVYNKKKKRGPKKSTDVNTRYTNKAYQKVLKEMENGKMYEKHAKLYFEKFIELLNEKGIIEPFSVYERCWVVNGWENVEVAKLIENFSAEVRKVKPKSEEKRVSWNLFAPIMLSAEHESFDEIRKSLKEDISLKDSTIENVERIINELKEKVGEIHENND